MAAAGGAHLSRDRVNVGLLRECARRELLQCLNKQPGSKALVWDDKLTGPFGLIAEYKLLKEHEVEVMFPLGPGRLPPSQVHNVIFITRPKPSLMDIIADNVLSEEGRQSKKKEFTVLFVPRKTLLCERRLMERNVSFINVDEYPLELIPLDSDVLSLEMESSFKECYLEYDFTSLFYVANSLMTLQTLYGTIPKIYAKGIMSKRVLDMMMRKKREAADSENQVSPQIDTLLLIDRNVDLLTPMFTQLTYEGLIDELYGIHHTTANFPQERFPQAEEKGPGGLQQPQQPPGPKKVVLNSSDELFDDLRDLNFSAVGIHLSRKAKQISAAFEEHKSAKTVGEVKQYVQKIPYMQRAKASLATHTTIAEMIKEETDAEEFRERIQVEQELAQGLDTDKINPYIEKCFGVKKSLFTVLRLLCAQCLTNDGFKPKTLEFYLREILQTYGFEHVYKTLSPLQTVGLIRQQSSRSYNVLRKSLKLVVEDVQEQNPNDIAYVFSGYAPLTVRLAQFLARPQAWRGLEEVLRLLPGPAIEEIQRLPPGLQKRASPGAGHSMDSPSKVTLIYFIGGCTHAEISALRFLSRQENSQMDYLIATTKIINGTALLQSIMEEGPSIEGNPFT
ncbi:vacuolar protein sorting-associated protein 33A-like [Acropora millepora]|uniref:vacuolar protein sorting-associated protein 33A-like n=2 Tax=Acropora TaxID=6127 RepID=UPI001CF4FCA9|nr:vacuolar protein sorting-associated protein 33A-like [Acropora millepora]